MSAPVVEEIVVGVGFALAGGALWFSLLRAGAARWRLEHRERLRAQAAHAAAVEASLVEPAFSPDLILQLVDDTVGRASEVWRGNHRMGPSRSDDQVVRRWANAAAEFWGSGLRTVARPKVDFLRVVNRDGEDEDRVTLRVRVRLHRAGYVPVGEPHTVTSDMRWTLGRHNDAWRVLSITSDPLAEQVLDGDLVPASWADRQRLREQALVELSADATVALRDLAGLVSPDHEPSEQLLELGVIDRRFERQMIDAAVEHMVQAWEASSNGSDAPLAAVASADVTQALLTPTRDRRLVLRDAKLEGWQPLELMLTTNPPKMAIAVTVSTVRYLVTNPNRRYVGGSMEARHEITLTWTLLLSPSALPPWRLILTTTPLDGPLSDPQWTE